LGRKKLSNNSGNRKDWKEEKGNIEMDGDITDYDETNENGEIGGGAMQRVKIFMLICNNNTKKNHF
jgi:hypothetical protein